MKGLNKEKYIEVKQDENVIEKSNLKGDRRNFAFLILLYVLQGVPQGISVAIPILLQNRGVSYNDQAEFSISYFPFSMKLLWAPIVDSVYLKSFGRRKTWICGSQIFVGIFMIYTSLCVDEWMGIEGNKPQILMLTIIFFILWFLTSCQDIAVDGYGLTFNFKSEKCETSQELHETTDYGIKRAYPILVDIIKLKPVIQLCTMIFTIEVALAAIDACLTRATYAADGSFFSKIADPLVGGTYMTLINTFGNLGKRVSVTFFLWLVDKITWKQCSSSANTFSVQNSTTINTCANILEKEACIENGGNCETIVDGFYIEIAISVIIALIWYKFMKSVIFQLQRYPREDWFVLTGKSFKTDCDMKAVKIEKK
ncbi:hypothetical protein PVAND_011093 [Polypedilum vanderplanki]|uniref:Acetyl-coenzyme A transporter 1 n=1 Tax=Polypedilum vanderplanki TaxID=319348 RepID=A0A9J6CIG9_POLVA|nr:hypothetical protein PVAND_011093 [Polypedilum vanderplanki]